MIDCEKFRLSLKRLEKQRENHRTLDESLPSLLRGAVAESTIRRFETCYDCLWKVPKRHPGEELGLPDVPNSPKPVFRIAAENALVAAPHERWMDYARKRADTAHDCDGEKARSCLAIAPAFIADATALHETLTGSPWQ